VPVLGQSLIKDSRRAESELLGALTVTDGSASAVSVIATDQEGLPPVLSTKLLPPRPPFRVVDRSRLIDSVSHSVSAAPLTLICAPAGSGKTILAAAWAQAPARALPVSWLTLDDRDDQPGVFWSHVLDSLAQDGVVSASAMRPTNPDTVDTSFIERLAVDLLTRTDPVVLVIDEAERLKSRTVAEQLDLLLRNAGPRLRLLLVSRSDPVLPVHRYRLEGTVAEIRYNALAFTVAEARALLECHGVEISEPATRTLVERTEGWAAGICLATMALRRRAGQAAADEIEVALGPTNLLVTEYLIAEVLDGMPASDRELLLRTSVAREISPGLADELTGRRDSERTLMDLSHRNSFVHSVPRSPGSYRTHSLFREFLGAQLALESPADVAELHRRAADWFAASGAVAEAVDHAVAAGDWVGAAGLVVGHKVIGTLLVPTPTGTGIAKSLSRIPGDVDSAEISVVRSALALTRGDLARAQLCLTSCEEHLDSASTDLLLAAAVVRAQLGDVTGETDATMVAVRCAREALRALPIEHAGQHQELWALVLGFEGTAHLRVGNFDPACASLAQALVASAAAGCERQRLRYLAVLALAEVCRGNLSRGQELADTTERLAGESGVVAADRPAAAHQAHAWVALERQDLAGAQHWLGRAARLPEAENDEVLASVSTLLRIRLRRDRGDIKGAQRLLGGHVVHVPWLQALFEAETVAIEGGANGRMGEPRELAAETPSEKVEHLLLRAQRYCARGNLGAGRSAVIRAIALAEDEGIRRPFAHIAPQVRLLIRTDPDIAVRAAWLRPEHNSVPRGQPVQADTPRVDQALSDKELEVLRHLSSLLTTEEIAATMFISVNTVKTHIRGILRKLSVTRRNEAVRRARELNIV
jgi:LuxR family transcriptional regulator, maltose regulon positive regulatory protein